MLSTSYFTISLAILVIILYILWRRASQLLKQTKFAKVSLSTKYGKLSEQFMPFLKHYPYDPHRFRFLGTPIDGVQFDDDKIIFIEFKTAGGRLTNNQNQVKNAIINNRVYFKEIRLD